jgi:hypothetical protein
MKRKLQVAALALFGLTILSTMGYVAMLFSFTEDPEGKYASYEFLSHHRLDVLDFEGGSVTMRTCCGDEAMGTYKQEADGRWVWTYPTKRRVPGPIRRYVEVQNRWLLQRNAFELRIECLETGHVIEMRRRLCKDAPL